MYLTIDEFVEKYPDASSIDYIKCFNKRKPNTKLMALMIEVSKSDSYMWAGPFTSPDGKYWFVCKIQDDSQLLDLNTVAIVNAKQRQYKLYSKYSYPHGLVEKLFGKNWEIYDYEDKNYEITKCSRSALTHEEMLIMHEYLRTDPVYKHTFDLDAIINYEISFKNDWSKKTTTKEFPVRVYMAGNDDCSYTILHEVWTTALIWVETLSNMQNKEDYIRKNCVFTN